MNHSHLEQHTVLVLNKNWQAIHVKTPFEAISMMYANTATALHVSGEEIMQPLSWSQWAQLPYDDNEKYINTVNNKIRVPKIIILAKYGKVPQRRPKLSKRNIWLRDNYTCQYTGKKIKKNEGNIDHIIPKSKGGKTDWSNLVIACKEINQLKADRTPEQAGLRLIKPPADPGTHPVSEFINNPFNVTEWEIFLKKKLK